MDTRSNGTLDSLPGRYTLRFHCSNSPYCYFSKPVDLAALVSRLGGDFECRGLYDVLCCPKCKSRKFLVIFTPVHHSYPLHG